MLPFPGASVQPALPPAAELPPAEDEGGAAGPWGP